MPMKNQSKEEIDKLKRKREMKEEREFRKQVELAK